MRKDDQTWLKIAYVVFALLAGYTASKAVGTLGVQTGWSTRFSWYSVAGMGTSVLVGVLLTWLLQRKASRNEYFLASIAEVRRVTWPSALDTRRMTIVVCVVVGIFSIILSLFDFVWAEILKLLLA